MNRIKVTCAIIVKDQKVLTVQRSESMNLPLKWEFPGGKIEQNETDEECIVREIKEELNIEIKLLKRLKCSFYEYPNMPIELIPFLAQYIAGEISLKEHKQFRFLSKDQLGGLDWAAADLPILKELQQL